MRRIYEPYAYGDGPVAGSYWRTTVGQTRDWPSLDGESRCDVAILGGGFTGLTSALHLAEAGADVAVLEAETPGWGASGRNGGFCCLGGAKLGARAMVRRFGKGEARLYYDAERAAVDLVAETLNRLSIDADTHSRGETMLAHRPEAVAELAAMARHAKDWHGVECEVLSRAELAGQGLGSDAFHGAVTTPIGFALNPLKYVLGLTQASESAGARIFARSPALGIAEDGSGWTITTPEGQMSCRTLLVATNGYSSEDLPRWLAGRYLPVQSNVLVTRPLSDDELAAQGWTSHQMCYDTRNLLHYFRLMPDRRMLFGLRGAVEGTEEAGVSVRARARADFDRFFPAWAEVETPYFWSGLAALSLGLTPFAGPVPGLRNAFAALCYHGNGVAMGSYSGALLADLALGRPLSRRRPDFMARPLGRFPLGRFRRHLLRSAYHWYSWKDGA